MIRSYASDIGKDVFQGNWSVFSSREALEPLEDCFIDLRILDAAATKGDIQRAFRGRLVELDSEDERGSYVIRQPSTCSFVYRIEFIWSAGSAEAVNVKLSPSGEKQ